MPDDSSRETEALALSLVDLGTKFLQLAQGGNVQADIARMFAAEQDPLQLAFMIASVMNLDAAKEQALLETPTRVEGLRMVMGWLSHEVDVLELRNKIANEARTEMSKEQKEYVLRQQKRAIEQELGEGSSEQTEVKQIRERLEKADLPDDILKEAEREIGPAGEDGFGAARIQCDPHVARIRHRVAVDQDERRFAGPQAGSRDPGRRPLRHRQGEGTHHRTARRSEAEPGRQGPHSVLGGRSRSRKTSLGQSIARALGRKFERMSLGGLHDEAELRGHRRTYIGAIARRLIQAMRRAGVANPVLMLDEVDKLGRDFRGDPAAALLEILDPEQNKTFRDNYLDLPFDLSKVLFVTTANTLDTIPAPLLDRMEILRLSGYSEEEKMQIARRYLLPRQLKHTGLTAEQFILTDEALHKAIASYTREAGVRRLEQVLGRIIRKVAVKFAEGSTEPVTVEANDVPELLGPENILPEQARKELPPGVATGLAWTETGGDVLYIEAALLPNGKELVITGQLGEVMQESAKTARSYLWSHARDFGLDPDQFLNSGLHIHVPAGAIPKDGPSAGVTMTTALASFTRDCRRAMIRR